MLRVISGAARMGKTAYIFDQIADRCREGKKSVLIVPESYSHQAERMLLTRCGNEGGRYAQVCSFSKLARDILEHEGIRDRSLDQGGLVLLMTRAFLSVRAGMTHYKGVLRPWMVTQFIEAADELVASRIEPDALAEAAGSQGKLHDLSLVYRAYTALVEEQTGSKSNLFDLACQYIPTCELYTGAEAFIDGFSGFTAQRYAAIEAFSRRAAVTVSLLIQGEGMHFTQQRRTLNRLKRMGKDGGSFQHMELIGPPAALGALANGLFDYRVKSWTGEGAALLEAANPLEECEWTAAKIRELTLDGGVRMREIALVCPDLEGYGDGLAAAFERYQVPLFLSRPQDILKKPPLVAAIGGLEAVEDGLSQESVFAWLKLGLWDIPLEELCMLENYAAQWDVSGSQWYVPFTRPTSGFGEEKEDEADRLAAVNATRARVAAALEPLRDQLRAAKTGGEYVAALRRHFDHIRLEDRLERRVALLDGEGEARLASEYAQLYDIINTALDQYEAVCGDAPQSLAEFCSLLRLTLGQYRVDTIPISLDAIQACDFDRLETAGVKHVFILGAREGLMPRAAAGAGLITEEDRLRLEDRGIKLTQSNQERAFENQSYIYRAFAGAVAGLTVSWPRRTGGGEECGPSYMVSRLAELAPGLAVSRGGEELETLVLTAPIPAFEAACACVRTASGGAGRAALERFEPQRGEFFRRLEGYAGAARGPIRDKKLVRKLYGERLPLTASRLEKVASCRFSYFMQYGMRAKPLKKARFGAPEAGTFIHEIVEKSVEELCRTGRRDIEGVVGEHVEQYIIRRFRGREHGARFRAVFRRLVDSAVLIVTNIYEEITLSEFKPLYFELDIGGDTPPLSIRKDGYVISVTGKVDRVDGWVKDGRLFVKVVDYKTGSKSFRLSDVLYGLNVQMFLYLLMVQKTLRADGRDAVSAGALYVPAKAPYIPAEEGEPEPVIQSRLDKELKRVGLVLSDVEVLEAMEKTGDGAFRFLPVKINRDGSASADSAVASAAQMGKLLTRVEKHLETLGGLLAAGDIEANPYRKGRDFTACQWCDYRAACHFDEKMEKDKLRFLPALKNSEVFAQLEQEEKDGN